MPAAASSRGLEPAWAGGYSPGGYSRHRPESTLLYQIVERHYPEFLETLAATGRSLPRHVQREFEEYLKCGRLEHGFLRVVCEGCHAEKLVAFSCKRRGFCPSCGARRMTESAAHLVDEVLPQVPMRQWVLSVPFALRYLFARDPKALRAALEVIYRTIAAFQRRRAGYRRQEADCGAVTLIQRFGSALNLNVHFHMLVPDGVYQHSGRTAGRPQFVRIPAPDGKQLQALVERISERVGRQLQRRGILVREAESSHLELEPEAGEDALPDL
jgi:ribosomal protein S27E